MADGHHFGNPYIAIFQSIVIRVWWNFIAWNRL